jgi:hypothetical protein
MADRPQLPVTTAPVPIVTERPGSLVARGLDALQKPGPVALFDVIAEYRKAAERGHAEAQLKLGWEAEPKAELPPLTRFCTGISEPTEFIRFVDHMTEQRYGPIDPRGIVWAAAIMAAAGFFVRKLHWDGQEGLCEGSDQFFGNTNLDVITAEAIIWIGRIMQRLQKAEEKAAEDDELKKRLGFGTSLHGHQVVLRFIERKTGVNFTDRATQSRRVYLEAEKEGVSPVEPFATIVLQCVGCQSLTEPLKAAPPFPPLMEWTQLTVNVSIFYTTMPDAFYEVFKNILRERPDQFPEDKDDDD